MKRNIIRYAESGALKLQKKEGERYDLTLSELRTICGTAHITDDIYEAVHRAFNVGFEAGVRFAERKGRR